MKIIFATGNKGKIVEVKEILKDICDDVVTMKEAGVNVEIIENGTTFSENALIKAKTVFDALEENEDVIVMSDDSGLEVDALNKEPGIFSARYMGEDTSYEIKNQNIIDRLEGVEGNDRSARFVCAIAAVIPGSMCKDGKKKEISVMGNFEGLIAKESSGTNGFGYDPIFFVPECGLTSAELSMEEKNKMSHRGKALRLMREELEKVLLAR